MDKKPGMVHYTPYSKEWFVCLTETAYNQAVDIAYLIDLNGKACCMICGSMANVEDYEQDDSPLMLRLCDLCYEVQQALVK